MVDATERDYAVVIPLDPRDRVLLQCKDDEYFFWPEMWCTLGGGLKEEDRGDPMKALDREMEKENGLEFHDVELFDSRQFYDGGKDESGELIVRYGRIHYFGAGFDGDLSKIVFGEGAGFKTFGRGELAKYNGFGLVVPDNFEAINDYYEYLGK